MIALFVVYFVVATLMAAIVADEDGIDRKSALVVVFWPVFFVVRLIASILYLLCELVIMYAVIFGVGKKRCDYMRDKCIELLL